MLNYIKTILGLRGQIFLVFFLALLGMICWGIAPVFGKMGLYKTDPLVGLAFRTYLSATLLTGWILRSGTFTAMKDIPVKAMIFLGIEGILATLVGDWAYYAALKYGDVSFVTLLMSCSPIISIITAMLFLKEQITPGRLIGAFFIIIGLIFITR